MRLTLCAPMAARASAPKPEAAVVADVAGAVPAASAADEVERDVGPAGGCPECADARMSLPLGSGVAVSGG